MVERGMSGCRSSGGREGRKVRGEGMVERDRGVRSRGGREGQQRW